MLEHGFKEAITAIRPGTDVAPRSSPGRSSESLRSSGIAGAAFHWLRVALAEIDYGVLLLDESGHVVHANPAAHAELRNDHPLQLIDGQLRSHDPRNAPVLQAAIDGASRRGLRKLVGLHTPTEERINLSVVPLCGYEPESDARGQAQPPRHAVLLMLGKRRIGGQLAIESFARLHGLSSGETRVLLALGNGVQPTELARQHGVAIATVRTQIGSIRAKTGAASIRSLLNQLATLPPLLGILHREQGPAANAATAGRRLVLLPS